MYEKLDKLSTSFLLPLLSQSQQRVPVTHVETHFARLKASPKAFNISKAATQMASYTAVLSWLRPSSTSCILLGKALEPAGRLCCTQLIQIEWRKVRSSHKGIKHGRTLSWGLSAAWHKSSKTYPSHCGSVSFVLQLSFVLIHQAKTHTMK